MDPITRKEMYLSAVAGDTSADALPDPITREELYLSAAAGDTPADALPDPITREEFFLKAIVDNGGGGDTPSPSGDPNFSKIIYTDAENWCYILLNEESGNYEIPSEVNGNVTYQIFICTPVKTITHLDRMEEKDISIVFTPDDEFELSEQTEGDEVMNGDGKLYYLYSDLYITRYDTNFSQCVSIS